MRIMLEVFDAVRRARPIARVAYPLIVRTKTSDMRSGYSAGRNATLKESDVRRIWNAGVL